MKGLQDYRFKLVWASSFMGVKAFEQFFYAIGGNLYIRHFGVWAGFKGGVRARVWKDPGPIFKTQNLMFQIQLVMLYQVFDIYILCF